MHETNTRDKQSQSEMINSAPMPEQKNLHFFYLQFISEVIVSDNSLCRVCQKHSGGSGKHCD